MQLVRALILAQDEEALLGRISFDEHFDHDAYLVSAKAAEELMSLLLARHAIPEHRLRTFTDPEYRFGRSKGSWKEIFERNGTRGAEIYRHPNFFPHLRYFILGPDLPDPFIEDFGRSVEKWPSITSDDVRDVSELIKGLLNRYRIDPQVAADEVFRLCLDCGIPLLWASHLREVVKKVRLRRSR